MTYLPLELLRDKFSDLRFKNLKTASRVLVLTNTKLWNTDGSFIGRGAIVPGLNDVGGSSLFDIQNRLNVNKNGCAFPAGY